MQFGLGGDLLPVLDQIERDKGIKKEDLLHMIEAALVSAFKKHAGKTQEVIAHIIPETGTVDFFIIKNVVETVTNDATEIARADAQALKEDAKIGDTMHIKTDISGFGRIAAQTAKQVMIQRMRESEKNNLYKEFKSKEGTVLNAQVNRIVNGAVIFDLGKAEGIMPEREQIRPGMYKTGSYMKVYILKVDQTPRGPKILLSRTHPEFVKRLFEIEVPEIYDKTVEIKSVVRDPGKRAKVSVVTTNPKVDPIGACVGIKGVRVKAVINEIEGERIDLIPFTIDTKAYMMSALTPAKITDIVILDKEKHAEVIVPDDQLSIAIGKQGQNVKLAARLVGWHLDVKSEGQKRQDKEKRIADSVESLEILPGIGEKTAALLVAAGYTSVEKLKQATKEELLGLQGIGEKLAEKILHAVEQ